MNGGKRTAVRLLFLLYLGAVAWLCFGRFDSLTEAPRFLGNIPMDKVVHFLMFLPFPVLAFLSFGKKTEKLRQSLLHILSAFAAGSLFAAGTEAVQGWLLPYRTGDPADLLADFLALGTGSLLILVIDLWKQRQP